MPKRVYDDFYRALCRDINSHYKNGDKYFGVREIAKNFKVSLQTAQKGVSQLSREGLVEAKPKLGITVSNTNESPSSLSGKKIIVLSNKQDLHFYSSFYKGVEQAATGLGVVTEFMLNTYPQTDTLGFGEYLTSLKADGLIMLSFVNSALPFYHAMREGVDMVSDIILDTLPTLPARQTDNYKHAYDAAKMLISQGCTKFYVFGYYPKKNKRFLGFQDAVKENNLEARYIEMSTMTAISEISEILNDIDDSTGLFSSDYSATYVIDSLCSREKVVPSHLLVFDTDEAYYHAQYLPPILAVGPPFKKLGESLCEVLLTKWKTGSYPLPLQTKI
ncbi:GntR family transcriptional regulator [uncultured Sphaerochaeta sp.]|uniref:GntR family transcriptional regulator n=1 Tax=uncultured Sphaerochaeta sp. TaxID=886478 RepID=UPI002A0A3C15|nr:substrate-binding domain-containing protein [uncultured Sphaerochaeta sp.]